jgi:enoyl-CoA hydratase
LDRPADGVTRLTLDRPERRNALSIALRDELSDELGRCAADPEVRVLVLTGAGPTFSAGFDLGEFDTAATEPAFARRLWASSDRYHHAVATFPLPVVAAVNGPAIAGGFDLAVLCDIRVLAATARFAHPEHTFGEVVYGPLRELVGGGPARELMLTGRVVEAEEARRLGLASIIVEPAELAATSVEVASTVARAPRTQLLAHKAKILRHAGLTGGPTATLDL